MLDVRDYNAPNLALPTNLRAMLRCGELLWGTACHIPHEEAARIVALLPHEFCFIDGEHTPLGPTEIASVTRAIQFYSSGSMVPVVRCPTPDLVTHALNAGAGGIVMPHIQNKEQAEALVRLVRFPPLGDRSVPPYSLLGRQKELPPSVTAMQIWNEHVAVFAQVEDIHGLEKVEEIASVPGVDAIMVGSHDLQTSLGLETSCASSHHPQFLASIERIQRAADANGIAVMGGGMADTLVDRIKLGWRLFICSSDAVGIVSSGTQGLEKYKKMAEGTPRQQNGVSHQQ